jgi:hypothetical protein
MYQLTSRPWGHFDAEADEEELAVCNIEIIDNLEKSLKISADWQSAT